MGEWMGRKEISVIITDLDNTLYDWFEVWSQSFSAMLNSLTNESGIPKETLIEEIKAIHEKYGTSEYALLIQEIPSLRAKHPGEDLTKVYAPAVEAYQRARAEHLCLYPRVLETLKLLKGKGCLVVGYTESQLLYTDYRIRTLDLDGLIAYLYSPASHDLPPNLPPDQVNLYPTDSERLKYTVHRATPKDAEKPNPDVLLSIISDIGATKEQAIYVGDSRFKDILMAQQAGVIDVYAAYGVSDKEGEEYQLLRQVTHWKAVAVEKEKSEANIIATYTLQHSFGELLALFAFVPFAGRGDSSRGRNSVRREEADG
jgi:phosphoglycolate phosphatase-like HAD superfamily hydrolase